MGELRSIAGDLAELEAAMMRLKASQEARRAEEAARGLTVERIPWPTARDIRDEHFAYSVARAQDPWDMAGYEALAAQPVRECAWCRGNPSCECATIIERAEMLGKARITGNHLKSTVYNYSSGRLENPNVVVEMNNGFKNLFLPLPVGTKPRDAVGLRMAELRNDAERNKGTSMRRTDWDWGSWMSGPPGCGKSHMAAAYVREACVRGYRARYIYWPRLVQSWKAVQRSDSGVREEDVLARLTNQDILAIDEVRLDLGGKNDWKAQLLANLLEQVKGRNCKLIVTTNFSADQLARDAGEHVVSRMGELMPEYKMRSNDARSEMHKWR